MQIKKKKKTYELSQTNSYQEPCPSAGVDGDSYLNCNAGAEVWQISNQIGLMSLIMWQKWAVKGNGVVTP